MAGTKIGGQRAAATNKAKHDAEYRAKYGMGFYAYIGSQGGKLGKTGGFAANRELASIAGAKGGAISRRGRK
jgi:general stress protein YciG